jgi:hypothetical protein
VLLASLFEQRGKEIIILVDKCISTRYEDFSEKVMDQIADLVYNKIYKEHSEINRRMSRLASKAFINSMLDILRMDLERADMEALLLKALHFYFHQVMNRL